ncbi:DUF3180 domain-containing protein [Nonomuraea sp. RK-328]|nr:DUF3180 domain-containing protein [Nonomuraea sp. RK-328]
MRPTRPGVLVGLVVVVALLTWMVVRQFYADLPIVPWTAIPTVLLLALGETYSAWMTKARLDRKPGTKPVEPLAVARLAALAKASSYVGAVFGGMFAGFALHTVQLFTRETPRTEFFIATGSFLAFVALICAALFLEHSCRIPEGPEDAGPR